MNKILLHACCGPCLIYPAQQLQKNYQVDVFYFNPNIHPELEYQARLETIKKYCAQQNLPFLEQIYDPEKYFSLIKDPHDNRCAKCYELRLGEAARYAVTHGYQEFSTTLMVSPYQNLDLLRKVGSALAEKYNLKFHVGEGEKGWRRGFAESRKKARALEMYLQKYCGCIYSQKTV